MKYLLFTILFIVLSMNIHSQKYQNPDLEFEFNFPELVGWSDPQFTEYPKEGIIRLIIALSDESGNFLVIQIMDKIDAIKTNSTFFYKGYKIGFLKSLPLAFELESEQFEIIHDYNYYSMKFLGEDETSEVYIYFVSNEKFREV